jgi:hypothetical protein
VPKRMTMVACSSIESSTNRTRAGWGASARRRARFAELRNVITRLFRLRCRTERLLAYLVRRPATAVPPAPRAKPADAGHGICGVTPVDGRGRVAASTECRKAGRNDCQAVWPAISTANRSSRAVESPDKANLGQ